MQRTMNHSIGRLASLVAVLSTAMTLVMMGITASGEAYAAPTGAAAALTPSTPAESPTDVTAMQDCDSGNLCFWVNTNYGGARGKVSGNNPDWRAFSQWACWTTTWNDCASSAVNRGTQCTVYLFRDANYLGGSISIPRGGNRPNLATQGFNDETSSNRWC